jgi:beta-lactamase superfamily II metal-dependent hydrolase
MRPILAFLALATLQAKTLDIYFIDTEGGQATLIVSPSGQAMLIDAGYAGFSGRDADRIMAAAKQAHVKHLEAVMITHHHSDHEGGVPNLLERFTVGGFYDKGPSVEAKPDRTYQAYQDAMSKNQHHVIKPGDTIPIKGLQVTVMEAAGEHIDRKGEANPFCKGILPESDDEIVENASSGGVLIEYGKFKFADLGDLTPSKEAALLCPENRVGKVDLFLSDHHGGVTSPAIQGMAPRVIVMNNGARKGGVPRGWKTLKETPSLEDMWQLHFSVAGAKEANVPDSMIANLEERCEGKYIKVSAESNGSFTVYNSRNKYTKTYAAR